MLLIVGPGGDLPVSGTVPMAMSAMFQLLTRELSGRVSEPITYAWTALICLVVTGVPALLGPSAPLPPTSALVLMLAGGTCSGVAQLLLLASFRRVPASTLAPLNYFQLMLAVLISVVVFQRPPDER